MANQSDRFLLLERSGNGKSAISSIFEMRLQGKKLHVRHGNKGQKLAKKIYKKQSISDANTLFTDKRKQKINEGYRIIKEQHKNNKSKNNNQQKSNNQINESLNAALPLSGKSIQNPHKQKQKQIQNQVRQQIKNAKSNKSQNSANGKIKRGKQGRMNKHKNNKRKQIRKAKHMSNGKKAHKIKKNSGKRGKNIQKRSETPQSTQTSQSSKYSYDEEQENNGQIANGYDREQTQTESECNSHIHSESDNDNESSASDSEDSQGSNSGESEEESNSNSDSNTPSHSSVQSGRSSDSEYEMDYEKMSDIMYYSLNKSIKNVEKLDWKPLKSWVRFNEYNDLNSEYALASQGKRIAGSCHELLVIYIRSKSNGNESGYNDKGVVYKRLLKLARDPEEDNKYHFDCERHVSQYLYKIASTANKNFHSRTDVCIWPVETIFFEWNGTMKYATIQAPFLPDKSTNNIFVKIEPNSGKPCVNDATVGRYQHLFSSITRGLDLIRDWQGYGVSQSIFLNVCNKFNVSNEVINQIKIRKNSKLQSQTQVLVVIDPVLTTYNAHYFNNNPTDFGVKAMDEWITFHDCVKCRCKYFNLLPIEEVQFGIADPDQMFFDLSGFKNKSAYDNITKLRDEINIYTGEEDCKTDDQNDDI